MKESKTTRIPELNCMCTLSKFWIDELEFLNLEQKFLYQILTKKIISNCNNEQFKKAKMYIECLKNEDKIGNELWLTSVENKSNLTLLLEGIQLSKEAEFKDLHKTLELNFNNFVENFRVLKKEIFDLVLQVFEEDSDAIKTEVLT
ncbi:MAG TPA: hypothetical protein VJ970_07775 [Flavobacteriaceae bacterium]|nr:hypothetical protein [Flavobacteriaceae bacterium]